MFLTEVVLIVLIFLTGLVFTVLIFLTELVLTVLRSSDHVSWGGGFRSFMLAFFRSFILSCVSPFRSLVFPFFRSSVLKFLNS